MRGFRLAAAAAVAVGITAAGFAATPAGATSGVMSITTSTTLGEDHHGQILINADHVTLDCAGHTITGTGNGIVASSRSNVVIRNCKVSGFVSGIVISAVTNFEVTGNTSTHNGSLGIFAWGSHGTVSGNVVSDNIQAGIGIGGGSSNLRIAANTAADNGGDGFVTYIPTPYVHYQSGISFINNISSGNGDSGFELNGATDGISVTGNRASDNGGVGFDLNYSDGYNVQNNLATGNRYSGFAINASSGNLIKNNMTSGNSDGIFTDRVTNSAMTDNVSRDNASIGMWMGASAGNMVARNESSHNGSDGFWTIYDNGSTLTQNRATNNAGAGYVIYQVNGAAFSENTATNNGRVGFTLNLSSHLSLTHNVSNNNELGFITYISTANTFQRNVANSNTGTGFAINWGSTDNLFNHNVGHANGSSDAFDGNPSGVNTWIANNFGSTNPVGLH